MTLIIGAKIDGRAIIAADSHGICGDHHIYRRKDGKIVALNEDVTIGFTSSFRMGQIIEHHPMTFDASPSKGGEYFWMVQYFIPPLQSLLREHGWTNHKNGKPCGTMVVRVLDELFVVYDDFQVQHVEDGYCAVGLKAEYAMGYLDCIRRNSEGVSPGYPEVLHACFEQAARRSGAVNPPYLYYDDGEVKTL